MALKKLRPTTPGQRFRVAPAFDEITTSTPEKSLMTSLSKTGGRNSSGKMSNRYIGGGHKTQYRIVDFKRDKAGVPAVVKSIAPHVLPSSTMPMVRSVTSSLPPA
jgi:large subunit ribosomal protein L2